MALNNGERAVLTESTLSWVQMPSTNEEEGRQETKKEYRCPVYLTADRDVTLFTVSLPIEARQEESAMTQRAVCVVACASMQ